MKLILVLSSLLIGATAFADRSGFECQVDLLREGSSYTNFQILFQQKDSLPLLRGCKNVDFRDVNADQRIDNQVFVTLDGTSLVVLDNIKRTVNVALIPGKIRDYVVMAGRLIISTYDHKVLVVARNGHVLEMLTSDGESYRRVTDIGMDSRGEELIMQQGEFLPPIQLTERQVTNRINDAGKYRVISLF